MRITGLWTTCVLVSCLVCWGCGGGSSSAPTGTSASEETTLVQKHSETDPRQGLPPQGNDPPGGRKGGVMPIDIISTDTAPEAPPVGLAGKWLVNIVLMWPEISQLWMVEITGDEGAYEAKVVESAVRSKVDIRELKQVEDRVSFQLAIDDQNWPFDGVVVAGRMQGAVELHDQISLIWLERTKLRSLPSAQASISPAGMADFAAAQRGEDHKRVVKGMIEFADRYPTSPLGFDALRTVVKLAKVTELSEEELRGAIAKYEDVSKSWGTRWHTNTIENIAYDLATAEGPPEAAIDAIALEYAQSAKIALPESSTRARRQSVEVAHAVALVNNNQAAEGKKLLDELIANSPDEGELRYRSALAAEKLGDFDGAIESLISLWPHPLATRELERIWKGTHGELIGLEERLDEAYQKRFAPIPISPYAGREDPANNQVALAELFTGTGCFPCVAPEVAFEALARTFKGTELIVLQYHLHVPTPDPLTNPDSEARAKYYMPTMATPFIFVGGKEAGRSGGKRQEASGRYDHYREAIEGQLKQHTPTNIDLTAKRDDDQIAIEVKLSHVEPREKLRLRLALVEEKVRFTGLNGVRLHHSVVRAMPGGADGIAVTEPDMTHHVTVNVGELQESLASYLADFEKQFSQDNNNSFEFPAKPLDLANLGVAAFLQDDETQEVMQAAFVRLEP